MFWKKKAKDNPYTAQQVESDLLIDLRNLQKIYHTDAGDFPALRGIDLQIGKGEFVSVIGKSGSGKTTLINMLTGIDRPTAGEIVVGGVAIHDLNEGQMASWRGRNMGVVFQFFQLLPTLSVFQNVMIPMDFCNMFTPAERRERAMYLLELVDIADHAHKPPSRLSGGQQQRAAIARALANDPPIIATDEPTGNLDSKTAAQIVNLFEQLVKDGKTILMVTHDEDLAERASRTVIISDGELVNEHLAMAFPTMTHELMRTFGKRLERITYAAGEPIYTEGNQAEYFYIVADGKVDVVLDNKVKLDQLSSGQYFGELAMLNGGKRDVQVKASADAPVEVLTLKVDDFRGLLDASDEAQHQIELSVQLRREILANATK